MIPGRQTRSSSVKHLKSHRINTPDRNKDERKEYLKKVNQSTNGSTTLANFISIGNSECLLQQHTYDSLHPCMIGPATHIGETILREGTLMQVMSGVVDHRLIATILLHTYRTIVSAKEILDTINTILRDTLNCQTSELQVKKQRISGMQYFIYKWLSPPHMTDFDDAPHFHTLLHLVNLVQHWKQLQWTAFSMKSPLVLDLDKSWIPITTRIETILNLYSPENHEYAERSVDVDNLNGSDGDISLRIPNHLSEVDLVVSSKPTSSLMKVQAFDPKLIAQQLTFIDKEIYSQFVVHHCLQHARDKHRFSSPNLIETFNRLSRVVDFTVRCAARAGSGEEVLYKWILVTKELRILKNFNCLMAVSQAVQKFKNEEAYADLFKNILKQHSKTQILLHEIDRLNDLTGNYEYIRNLQNENITLAATEPVSSYSHGSIPFLGPYLYQLNLTANAGVTITNDGHIHFLRKVHEFTILCNICCPQKCAKFYKHLQANSDFLSWYTNLPALVDDAKPVSKISQSSAPSNADPLTDSPNSTTSTTSKNSLTVGGPRVTSFSSNCLSKLNKGGEKSQNVKPTSMKNDDPLSFIMRVRLVDSHLHPTSGQISYKSILVSPNDMMPSVIRNCLKKFDMDESEYGSYQLIQILSSPYKEIVLPDLQNAYYAIAKNDPSGIFSELRQKPIQAKSVQSVKHRERRQGAPHLRHSSSMLVPPHTSQSSTVDSLRKLEFL